MRSRASSRRTSCSTPGTRKRTTRSDKWAVMREDRLVAAWWATLEPSRESGGSGPWRRAAMPGSGPATSRPGSWGLHSPCRSTRGAIRTPPSAPSPTWKEHAYRLLGGEDSNPPNSRRRPGLLRGLPLPGRLRWAAGGDDVDRTAPLTRGPGILHHSISAAAHRPRTFAGNRTSTPS